MSKLHELKTWPKFFEAVRNKTKTFEFRKNDRDFKVGDVLILQNFDPEKGYIPTSDGTPIDNICVRVTYVMTEGFGLPDGMCIMGFEHI